MASIKILKKIHDKNDSNSLVKDLIALRPITPIVIKETHPLEVAYTDNNPPPKPIDQFAPYLSRKTAAKRSERIEKLKGQKGKAPSSFILTKNISTSSTAQSARSNADNDNEFVHEYNLPQLSASTSLSQHLKMESTFDRIASGAAITSFPNLIESTLQVYFLAEKVLFFHDISSVRVLYCPSTTAYCPHGTGIIGYTQYSRKVINAVEAGKHVSYQFPTEGNWYGPHSRVLSFPLYDEISNVVGVVAVVRKKTSPPFSNDDEKFIEYLQSKCKLYSRWLFQPLIEDGLVSTLINTCRLKNFIENYQEKLTRLFSCRSAEIWSIDKENIYKYEPNKNKAISIPVGDAGIAGFSLRKMEPVSCISARVHSAFSPRSDGNGEFSVLSLPIKDPDSQVVYALVLRGKRIPQFFTDMDEKVLAKISPYIIMALCSSELIEKNHRALKDSLHQQKRLGSLLEVAEALSGQLRMDVLIPNIMSKACDLVKADRCSLFMVNESRDKLVTSFQGGLANSIEIPITAGIVGYTATTGEILNIKDAYEDSRFNRATDLATGYRTLTLLCVPIFDEKGGIRGVTEMINKIDGTFTEEDERMIKIFNVFTGISIENARLYRASIELSLQLRSFLEISYSLQQPQTIKKLMEEIIKNTRKVVGAVRALIFMNEDSGISSDPFITDDDMEEKFKKNQQKKFEETEDTLGVKRAIIQRLLQGKSSNYDAEEAREEEFRRQAILRVEKTKESLIENNDKDREHSFIMVPIMSSDRALMGAVMLQWKKNQSGFTFDDLKLLESYSVFLSVSLERSRLKSIAQLGSMEVEIQKCIQQNERQAFRVPLGLELEVEEKVLAISQDFQAIDFKGIELFKVMYFLFDHFDLCTTFKITNETFFHFLFELRASYNRVPYHNWIHAVDVCQFLAYTIQISGLGKILSKFEILALLTAAICHDANHDGFSNQYNVKAQTPLGILFKNQSVMETHHCSVSIGIITKDECNIFKTLTENESITMWTLFINLILATDMAKHFNIMEQVQEIDKKSWESSEEGRLGVMQLLIKCADVSNVARKLEIADRWCDVLCEEFFRQGELEKANGMEYSSPMNDREHLDKAKSQIGFYKSICLPLFQQTKRFLPKLEPQVVQVKSNLKVWIERNAEEEKMSEEKRRKLKEEKARLEFLQNEMV
ncbi:3'5'-cyclic nucleotide phosphodiesterase family protein [Tritrichomonas foetus]|uniref:3'5'-cyclic nucleotide phosphodiesterase family protein n=1 Tax=Tritrichomonas foetus TaxID=1144522 RepID=A0A1J4IZ35_9EUKA|nr:3'5'-cyclic nucleotide phosphodiesterase family protein [Tritrichomonas foetus]|eukprot:OHS92678.1 3'5'-cyclic nucleotide phosphodiesterase family protein [Tritrichomonas foetus]